MNFVDTIALIFVNLSHIVSLIVIGITVRRIYKGDVKFSSERIAKTAFMIAVFCFVAVVVLYVLVLSAFVEFG